METEKLAKTKVALTKSGIYPLSPFKMEYKLLGEYEAVVMSFQVQLGYKLACYARKVIFFKGDKDRINKEINYLLKFVCEDCLKNTYTVKSFKEYVEAMSSDVNKVIRTQMDNKTLPIVFGKILKKKDSQYAEMPDYISKNGYEQQYLALPEDVHKALYFTEWEIENMDTPFVITEKAAAVAEPLAASSTNWDNDNDGGLPF